MSLTVSSCQKRVWARRVGAPKGGCPKGGGEGWPRRGKFRVFFFPLPPQNSFFSSLSGCLLGGILVVFEAPGRSNVTFGVLCLSCKPRRPRAQTWTFEGPGASNTTKIPTRRPPEREEKNEFCGGRGETRSEILGGPGKGGPGKGGPWEGRSGGTEHDQTKTLKPTPTRETPLHETVKQAPTPLRTHG